MAVSLLEVMKSGEKIITYYPFNLENLGGISPYELKEGLDSSRKVILDGLGLKNMTDKVFDFGYFTNSDVFYGFETTLVER